jgi:hypothetical protein
MALSFIDHVWEEGSENIGGALGSLYWIPGSAADISGLTCVDGVTILGDIAAVGDQDAIKIYATENSINVSDAQAGEIDGEITSNTLVFFTPGSKKTLAALKRKITVVPGIWFFRDSDYNLRVIGLTAIQDPETIGEYFVTKDIQARVTAKEGTHGTRGDTRKGTSFTVTYMAPHEALFIDGKIPHPDFVVDLGEV